MEVYQSGGSTSRCSGQKVSSDYSPCPLGGVLYSLTAGRYIWTVIAQDYAGDHMYASSYTGSKPLLLRQCCSILCDAKRPFELGSISMVRGSMCNQSCMGCALAGNNQTAAMAVTVSSSHLSSRTVAIIAAAAIGAAVVLSAAIAPFVPCRQSLI